ncbi:MAG: chemotaxis protein CheW [Chromatiales bacterium]|jgi:purine-binding chemotaxis protein CheW
MTEQAIAEQESAESIIEEVGEQYLTFNLAGEDYGIDILRVQEIRGWEDATRLPNTPEYVRGVVNLRGTIVPIYDLRLRFNMPFREYTENTVVIVIKTETASGNKSLGIVVDAVSDVLHGYQIDISQSPDFGQQAVTEAISGLASIGDKMVVLIDVDKLINDSFEKDLSEDQDESETE